MIICICFQVTEKQIKECLPCSIYDIMEQTNCALGCGQCFEALQKIVEQNKSNSTEDRKY